MGKFQKNFWSITSSISEARIKMILQYVSSKNNKPTKDPSVRMSDLNDSFTSFKNGGTHNSTFTQSEDTSFVSKSEEDCSINEAANEHILITNQQPKTKTSNAKKILVKISVEELDSSEEYVSLSNKKVHVQPNFNESDAFSKDSLEDISGIQTIHDSTRKSESYKMDTSKSFLEEYKKCQRKVLLPTDANYYTPRTKARTDDEKIADVIRELVLKKFEQRRKSRKQHTAIASKIEDIANLTDDSKKTESKSLGEGSCYVTCNLDSEIHENVFEKMVHQKTTVLENSETTASVEKHTVNPRAQMKQQALDFLTLDFKNENLLFASQENEKKCPADSSYPLNTTFIKEESAFDSENGKLKKEFEYIASYYSQEELENTSSCSSQGVYDCSTQKVLSKKEMSPYLRKIENNANSEKSVSYEEIQYDRREFLKQALGSQHEISYSDSFISVKPPRRAEPIYDRSIDTDNISTLISSESCVPQKFRSKKLKRDMNSVNTFSSVLTEVDYSDLVYESKYVLPDADVASSSQHDSGMSSGAGAKKPPRKMLPSVSKNNRDIFNAPPVIKRKSYPLYEDVVLSDDDGDQSTDGMEDLLQRIKQQGELINQADRLIECGSKKKHFYGSIAHLEAARIRLVSILRKDVLEKQLIDESYKQQQNEESVLAKLIIKNASCTSSVPYNEKSRANHYFIGVFQSDNTVLCTNFAQPNMFGDVEFDGQFTFEDLKSDFEIKFSLYTLSVEKKDRAIGCFTQKFNKSKKRIYLELVGTHKFQKNTANTKTSIRLENHKDYSASYKYSARADLFVKQVESLKGVLSIGSENKGHPVWNSRWCVLEGTNLKMYLFPSDEFYGKPLASLDLKKCQSCALDRSVGKLFNSIALKLTFDVNNTQITKYLVADDSNDLYSWQKHILMTIETTKCW